MLEPLLNKLHHFSDYLQGTFLLVIVMYYTGKVSTIRRLIAICIISIMLTSSIVPYIITKYVENPPSAALLSFSITLFNLVLIPVILHIFGKELVQKLVDARVDDEISGNSKRTDANDNSE